MDRERTRRENGFVPVLLVPLLALGVIAAGSAVAIWRLSRPERDTAPAAPGTPRIDSRLPVALWPARGDEPEVTDDARGWARMLAHLAHRDTVPDAAERARAVAFSGHRRRELDARRTVALEAHILRGRYDPDLIAAAWLYPLRSATPTRLRDLRSFGVSAEAVAIIEAAHELGLDDARVGQARRRLGVDPVGTDFGDAAFDAVPPGEHALLAALVLDAAAAQVAARIPR
jgi:hypothetical protein